MTMKKFLQLFRHYPFRFLSPGAEVSSFKGIHWSKHRRPVKWRNNDGSKSSDNSNTFNSTPEH